MAGVLVGDADFDLAGADHDFRNRDGKRLPLQDDGPRVLGSAAARQQEDRAVHRGEVDGRPAFADAAGIGAARIENPERAASADSVADTSRHPLANALADRVRGGFLGRPHRVADLNVHILHRSIELLLEIATVHDRRSVFAICARNPILVVGPSP